MLKVKVIYISFRKQQARLHQHPNVKNEMERTDACAGSLPLNVLPIYYILRCNSVPNLSHRQEGIRRQKINVF